MEILRESKGMVLSWWIGIFGIVMAMNSSLETTMNQHHLPTLPK